MANGDYIAIAIVFATLICIVNSENNQNTLCISSLTQVRCSLKKQFIEIDRNKNPCPRCRGGLGFGISGCNTKNSRRKCAPGLKCINAQCILDKDSCAYSHHLRYLKNVPQCNLDGTFSAKQCKGDMLYGRCFCGDVYGDRIFGFSWRKDAAKMNCACSRRRSDLEVTDGRQDVTLHCTQNGNYEELQCDLGICWCVDVDTGRPHLAMRAVPESLWKTLPCYKFTVMGEKYIRRCESVKHAQNKMLIAMKKRGTTNMSVKNVKCNYDGAYGAYKIENGISACISRDGKRIESYQDSANAAALQNCNCALDRVIFAEIGSDLPLSCAGNGNYNSVQSLNGQQICVDDDGFPISDFINSTIEIDCKKYSYKVVSEPDD